MRVKTMGQEIAKVQAITGIKWTELGRLCGINNGHLARLAKGIAKNPTRALAARWSVYLAEAYPDGLDGYEGHTNGVKKSALELTGLEIFEKRVNGEISITVRCKIDEIRGLDVELATGGRVHVEPNLTEGR